MTSSLHATQQILLVLDTFFDTANGRIKGPNGNDTRLWLMYESPQLQNFVALSKLTSSWKASILQTNMQPVRRADDVERTLRLHQNLISYEPDYEIGRASCRERVGQYV